MHICFLCSEYPPAPHGGIGTFTRTLGRALRARGHSVTVVGVYPVRREVDENDDGVHVVRLPHARIRGVASFANAGRIRRALARIHRERPIDVIEGQENSLAVLPADFVAPKTIRMNGGHHFFAVTLGRQPRPFRSWMEKRSFRRADFVCGVSRFVVDRTSDLLHLDRRAIDVLPNPVDTSLFYPRGTKPADRAVIAFVGTLCAKKGVRELVLALPQVIDRVPNAELWLIGPDSRDEATGGSFAESLKSLVPELFMSRIAFKGRVENVRLPELLAQASVCVYPSHMEALPVAFLEGMAMGKPVVASGLGPGPEVIQHEVSGLLCDPHDPRSIAEQIVRALTDQPLSNRIAARAWLEVKTRFSIDVLVDRNLEWYRRCAGRHGAEVQVC